MGMKWGGMGEVLDGSSHSQSCL